MFRRRSLFPVCLCLALCHPAHAERPELSAFQAAPSESAPAPAPARPDGEKSCVELYLEITALLEHKRASKAGYWNDRKNQIAAAAGFVFEPIWFYLGYSAATHLQHEERAFDATARIAELRAAAADKLCFVR